MTTIVGIISTLIRSEAFAAIISALAGAFVPLLTAGIKRYFQSRRLLEKTRTDEFNKAITSDNLSTIGKYLRSDLGQIGVRDYLNDTTTQQRVNKYINRLAELVKLPEDSSPRHPTQDTTPEEPYFRFDTFPDDPEPIASAVKRMREGEAWTALASLRRDLERKLTSGMSQAEARRGPPYKNIEDPDLRGMLRQFWFLASRAVHGEELSMDEAGSALKLARLIYKCLDQPTLAANSNA